MHLGRVLYQIVDLRPGQIHRYRRQAAQFSLGVFVDYLRQRQYEQPRRINARQAIPTRQLHIADKCAVRQHQMLVQIQAAIRPAWAPRLADHQTQHAVAPTADPILVGFGQEVVDRIHSLRVDLAQGLQAKIAAGIEERVRHRAFIFSRRRPAEAFLVVGVQGGTAAGIIRIEQEVLHVYRNEFTRVADLVDVRAAHPLMVALFALAPATDVLRPAREVEQARIVTEGKAAFGLTSATIRQTDLAHAADLALAAEDQRAFVRRPQGGAVVDVSEFVQHRRQHFPAHGTVGAIGFLRGRRAIGQASQQVAIEFDFMGAERLAIGIAGQIGGPVHVDAPIKLLDESGRQGLHGFVEQCLAGLLLGRAEVVGDQRQAQTGVSVTADQQ